jgi:hypothetical protein
MIAAGFRRVSRTNEGMADAGGRVVFRPNGNPFVAADGGLMGEDSETGRSWSVCMRHGVESGYETTDGGTDS